MKARAFFISLLIVPALSFSVYQAIAGQKAEEIEDRVSEAIAYQDSTEVIRSLIEKMSGELEKDNDKFPELIHEVEQYTQSLGDSATIALLHSLTAEMYKTYFNNERRNIQQRTDLQGFIPEDMREWTANLFVQKINEELNASLTPIETLKNTPTTRFADVLELGEDARLLRPTLYDFLLQRAIDIQPSNDFYQRWMAFRASQIGNPKAELLVSLDYLRYQVGHINTDKYKAGLDSLAEKFPDKECQLEIDLAKLQWMQATRYNFPTEAQRDSAKAALYAFCEQCSRNYTKGTLRANGFRNTKADLELPLLQGSSNNNVYPGKNLEIKITYRNTPKLTVYIYENRSNPETAMRNKSNFRGNLVKKIEYNLPIVQPFQEKDTVFSIPMEQLGLYEYEVTTPDEQLAIQAPFSVSRLAAISRTNADGKQEILVTDFESGKPLADVPVVCYNVTGQWQSQTVKTLRTDSDGIASLTAADGKQIDCARPIWEKDTASFGTGLSVYYNNIGKVREKDLTVYIFTDRGIYRPGQTVSFKGIIYAETDNALHVVPNMPYSVSLRDANYQEIAKKEFTTNEFGSFHGEFTLPKTTLNGNFNLVSEHTSTNFRVEEYKRPSFLVEIEPLKDEVAFGKEIILKGKATSFSGVALQGGKVTWKIQNRPFWLRDYMINPYDFTYDQAASGITDVDDAGNFQIRFTPERKSTSDNPVFRSYQVEVMLTDSKGETQTAEYTFSVGDAGIVLSVDIDAQMEKEKASAKIIAQTVNGEPVDTQGTYTIFRIQTEKADSISAIGTFSTEKTLDKTVFEKLPSGKYRLQAHTMDKNGVKVENEREFILFSLADARPPIPSFGWMPQSRIEIEENETADILFGTSESPAYVLYELFSEEGKLLKRERITMENENRHFPVLFSSDYGQGITASFTFIKNGEVYSSECRIYKKEPERRLTFRTETFRDHLLPGSTESWRFRLLDKDSLAVRAEVLASMYDASLDELTPYQWIFRPALRYSFWTPYLRGGDMFNSSFDSDAGKRDYLSIPSYSYDAMADDWYRMLSRSVLFYSSNAVYATGSVQLRGTKAMAKSDATAEAADGQVFNMVADESMTLSEPPVVAQSIIAEGEVEVFSASAPALRQNFAETAFFYPVLQTDERGEVSFRFTVPESNTTWKLQLLAHTDSLEYGYLSKTVITSKPIMVQPNLPRFLREGDEVSIASQVVNQLSEGISGTISLELFNPENDEIVLKMEKPFSLAKDSIGTVAWWFDVADWSRWSVVGCRILADCPEGSDGEQHLLPVLSRQILVTESVPFFLMDENETTVKLPKQAIKQPYSVTLETSSDPIWYAIQALSTANEPQQEDILSWFSVYYSNILAQYVAQAHPKIEQLVRQWNAAGGDASTLVSNLEKNEELKNILLEETPWVMEARSETEQKQRLELLFDINRAAQIRNEAFRQLQERQNWEGGWSWMKGMPANFSMTMQVLKGMAQLVQLNAVQYTEAEKEMQLKALRFLDNSVRKSYEELQQSNLSEYRPGMEMVEYLFTRSFYRDIPEGDAREAIRFFTAQAEKHWEDYGLYGRAAIAWLMQTNGQTAVANEILAWFRKTATVNAEKGMYWANNRASATSLYQPIETHCLIMALFHRIAPDNAEADRMKLWLLTQKRTQHWGSTPATQNAVYALLLTGSDWLADNGALTIENGKETIVVDAPYEKQTLPTVNAQLKVKKTGAAPAWGAVYLQYFAPLTEVEKQKGVLNVEKRLFVEENSQLRPISTDEPLRIGDKVVVRLTLRTDRMMDYVLLKDLRAACFEPAEPLSGSEYRNGIWYYRSSKDISENIYIEHLPQGTFVLEYPLYVARDGKYAGGMASIQCLYAPEFVSHTEGTTVVVPQ